MHLRNRSALLRQIAWILVNHSITFTLAKVPGKLNAADPASRTVVAFPCVLPADHAAVTRGAMIEDGGRSLFYLGCDWILNYTDFSATSTRSSSRAPFTRR